MKGSAACRAPRFTQLVPTACERSSDFPNLQDILTQQAGAARTDILGGTSNAARSSIPPRRGSLLLEQSIRFPALTNSRSRRLRARSLQQRVRTRRPQPLPLAACPDLNMLPTGRIDPNAVKLLNLYPAPNAGPDSTYQDSPALFEHANTSIRAKTSTRTTRTRSSPASAIQTTRSSFPGPFAGVADGGAFQQGVQTAKSAQMVAAYTHVFSPNVVNQVRGGFAHLHTTRFGPVGSSDREFRRSTEFQGIPQVAENGGLPDFYIGEPANLGSNNFLPSDEVTPDPPGHRRLHPDLRQAQLQDGHRVPAREVLHPAAGLVARRTSTTAAPSPIFRTRAAPTAAWPRCCCLRPRRPRPSPEIRIPTASAIPAARRASTPPTSTRPTTRRCTLPPTSRTTGR